jgi:hypothetical protein
LPIRLLLQQLLVFNLARTNAESIPTGRLGFGRGSGHVPALEAHAGELSGISGYLHRQKAEWEVASSRIIILAIDEIVQMKGLPRHSSRRTRKTS